MSLDDAVIVIVYSIINVDDDTPSRSLPSPLSSFIIIIIVIIITVGHCPQRMDCSRDQVIIHRRHHHHNKRTNMSKNDIKK